MEDITKIYNSRNYLILINSDYLVRRLYPSTIVEII